MIKNKLFSFLFVFISIFFTFNLSFAQIPDTVGIADTLRVGNLTAYPGSKVCVPVYAFNDENLGAIVVPLRFSSSDIYCDSVSFVGTRVADVPLKGGEIDSLNRTIKIYAMTFTQISPGSGLVANMWFKIKDDALPQTVEIDTYSTAEPPVYLTFVYTWAEEMTPAFVKGGITIKEKNLPPQIQPIGTQYVNEGDTLLIKITADDPEGDSLKISVLNAPQGAFFADSGNGKAIFRWVPPSTGPWSSVNSPFKVTFVASDGSNTSREDVEINVIDVKTPGPKDYVLEIGADSGFFQDYVTVPIRLTNPDSIVAINLLLNFDPSALSLLNVNKVNTRIGNWEYFHYKINQPEYGDIQISALPNLPDTIFTPPLPPGEGIIINLDFKIIFDTSPLSLLTSIRYKFTNSTDNTLSGGLGYQFISQDEIDYQDGYIYIRGMADLLGDINLNNIPFEIADAVLFNNFLTNPIKYPFNEQQKRNSDVNEDGFCCSLADFIYLLKKILEGDNPVIAKALPQPNAVQLYLQRSLSTLDLFFESKVPVGGAFLVIRHPGIDLGTPTLSSEAEDMTLLKREYPEELRLLIYSPTAKYMEPGKRKLFTIPIIKGMGNIELNKASFSDNLGNMIEADVYLQNNIEVVPQRFALFQNYPNPFNPETNISFALPEDGKVNLKIYNLKGQLVKVLIDQKLNSGIHTFKWDAKDESGTDLPSGIFFYKLIAGEYSEAKKMVRIK